MKINIVGLILIFNSCCLLGSEMQPKKQVTWKDQSSEVRKTWYFSSETDRLKNNHHQSIGTIRNDEKIERKLIENYFSLYLLKLQHENILNRMDNLSAATKELSNHIEKIKNFLKENPL